MMSPAIILVQPQMGENIGAAARAMANFGLNDLRIVDPRDGWPNERAEAMGVGAFDHIKVNVYPTFEAAIADCHFVLATTARPREMVKDVYTPEGAIHRIQDKHAMEQKTALVFGRERNGLENVEIAKCQGIITVPTSEEFPSINLAQAVLLLCYEWKRLIEDTPAQILKSESPAATQEELNNFTTRLMDELEVGGFFRSEGLKPHMVKNITNMFSRFEYTQQEINTLQGIVSALVKSEKD